MPLTITADEVRYRTVTLRFVDISDTYLASTSFIPAAQSEIILILSENNLTYDSLSSDEQNLVKAACIALCAQKVIESAPLRGSQDGPIKIEPISSKDKVTISEKLEDEWQRLLEKVGCVVEKGYVTSAGGDDYMPDSEDNTNIDFVSEDVISVWP